MSPEIIGVIGIGIMLILMYSGMWIGFGMLFTGFFGILAIGGLNSALQVSATVPLRAVGDYTFAALPLFLMMGVFITNSGFASDLFFSANKWIGHLRGGLAMASSMACAVLGVVTDSQVALIIMGKVAVPEMKKYGYKESLAASSIAGGATLASLIPPSGTFILYAMLTGASVGKLYIGAIIPGIVLTILIVAGIGILVRINPSIAPPGPRTSLREKISSLKYITAIGLIFIIILGGIYAGIFTPTEAGAIGAFGALLIGLISRRLNRKNLTEAILETAQITAMIVVLVVGAYVFLKFMTLSKLPFTLGNLVAGLGLSRYLVLGIIILVYIVLGMFTDIMSSVILTVPIIVPVVKALGFDIIWFGVLMAILIEVGFITPPMGLSVFTLSGVTGIPSNVIFRGVCFFLVIIFIFIVLMTIFPQIVLFLPGTM